MNQFSILQKWDESEQDKGDRAVSYVIKMFAYWVPQNKTKCT